MNFKNTINKGWPVKHNTEQTFVCSNFTIETQEKGVKTINVNNKDTRKMSDVVLSDV